jgi:hypothetical protein
MRYMLDTCVISNFIKEAKTLGQHRHPKTIDLLHESGLER